MVDGQTAYRPAMEIDAGACRLRSYGAEDSERLAEIADDRRIWINMTDRFPHPYSQQDADDWIALRADEVGPQQQFAIDHEDLLVGGIGVDPHDGLFGLSPASSGSQRHVGIIGYWLTPSQWNKGIATAALSALIPYALETFALSRLEATVYGWNPASGKVLEKCGFAHEGRQRNAFIKDGEVTDLLLYGLVV